VCNQAIEVTRKIAEHDFINLDIKTRNVIVRCSDECSYHVFFLDFGQCGFRDPSDSDGIRRELKRQENEEGAVGYLMMNHISRARGNKGKKHKETIPLPLEYKPSTRFKGEGIELYENAS
jgi:hypothetical protein